LECQWTLLTSKSRVIHAVARSVLYYT